jgi:hypothetical protein
MDADRHLLQLVCTAHPSSSICFVCKRADLTFSQNLVHVKEQSGYIVL